MKMRCELCGHEFDPAGLACHSSCPLGARCELICCPNCGYQVVDESRTVVARTLRRLLRRDDNRAERPARDRATIPLTHVREGTAVEVRRLDDVSPSRLSRLAAFGLAPGTVVTVVQRRPVPVLTVGQTELAVSNEVAQTIHVAQPQEDPTCT